jgi:hypothetical protein
MFSPIAPIATAHAVASSCSRPSSTENVMANATTSATPTNTFFGAVLSKAMSWP